MPKRDIFEQFLNKKRTIQGIDFSEQSDAVSRLQLFNLSGMDYQGQVSSGYGHRGIEANVGVSIDLTDFLAPLIPLPFHAGTKVTLSGKVLQEYLILIQRYPQVLYTFSRKPNPETRRGVIERKIVGPIEKPLCLLGLEGYSGTVSSGIELSAGARIPFPSLPDELGIEVDISAKAEAGAKLIGKIVRLKGEFSGFFPSPEVVDLRTHSNLEQVVDLLFSKPDKGKLKVEINAWISDMVANWLEVRKPKRDPKKIVKRDPKEIVKRLQNFTQRQLQKVPFPAVSDAVQRLLDEAIFSKVKSEFGLPVFDHLLDKWKRHQSTSDLLDRLNQLRREILYTSTNPVNMPPDQKVNALRQIQAYVDLLLICKRKLDPNSIPGLYTTKGNFFKLFSFAAEGQVSTGATSKTTFNLPTIPLANLPVKAASGGEVMAEASADIQRISYRYQSSLGFGPELYFTQDTWITCKNVKASANAFAGVSLTPLEYELKNETERFYNTMTYISSCLYWKPPPRLANNAQSPSIEPKPGSGLRIGMSFATRRLVEYAKANNRTTPRMTKTSTAICGGLNIDISCFNSFIDSSEIKDIVPGQQGFPDYVFLEAAFPLPRQFKLSIKQSSDGSIEPGHFGIMRLSDYETPESIRLRIRIADTESNETQLFKLGFPALVVPPVVIPKINIDLSMIKGAGQQGMFDYYVHWVTNTALNTDPALAKTAQEYSIPPVVFLHQ